MRQKVIRRAAVISECKQYRYLLVRSWSGFGKGVMFVMLNPSTADGEKDDATIRACMRRTRLEGYDWMWVVNLFAWRSTDPKALIDMNIDPIGPDNDATIRNYVQQADKIVVGWGDWGQKFDWRVHQVMRIIKAYGKEPLCLGMTQSGQPKHPLLRFIKNPDAIKLEPWVMPNG